MVRPQKDRIVKFNPDVSYFKPRGIPLIELEEVMLTVDEREAIRLADLQGLAHEEAGEQMGVSRATFGRIIKKARRVVADALINGKAIRVQGGNFKIGTPKQLFLCQNCNNEWEAPLSAEHPGHCPECQGENILNVPSPEAIP